jgi:UDP-GlcNAc3NAcA epimerase
MVKVVKVIGARPQIIKASAISRAIRNNYQDILEEIIIHTGQHYDQNMSEIFFEELQIPKPDYNLNVGSGSHGFQTAQMIEGIEDIIIKEKPDCIILYGDTNSTLAGAIAASKIHCPVIHVESGLRSFNKTMPEEINRIMCDHCSTLLFSPTLTGFNNLIKEGFNPDNISPFTSDNPKIYHCGDIMFDNTLYFSKIASAKSEILQVVNVEKGNYILATIHRNNNTDDSERLSAIFKSMMDVADSFKIDFVIPLHPRTSKLLDKNIDNEIYNRLQNNKRLKIIEPVSFLDMIQLEQHSKMIITDSGGVQKEAYFLKKPCVILRPQTEWIELVEHGSSIIVDADYNRIINAVNYLINKSDFAFPPIFGEGNASEFICDEIIKTINKR